MARKFWERVSATKIQFYNEPLDLERDAVDARIAEIQSILALPANVLALLVQTFPGVGTEAEFLDVFETELAELADQRDYYANENVTVVETIDVVDHRWISPAEMSLGAGTIESFCGEEIGSEAANAIDGLNGTNWQHDFDHAHELIVDLGYKKRIDGIRIRNTASPGAPLQLSGVDVFVAGSLAKIDDPESHVGVGLEFTGPDDNDNDLTTRNGRFVKLAVASTGHGSNHITIRELELRTRPRTFGL